MNSRFRLSRFALVLLTFVLALIIGNALTDDQGHRYASARVLEPQICLGEHFTDVCPGDYFYAAVLYLNNANVLSGYYTVPPCADAQNTPCFRPYSNVTRGQIAKVVSLAAGFNEPVSGQTFEDVPPDSTFYVYVERMVSRGIMGGYLWVPPCTQWSRPCFFPNNSTSRGQLAKIVSRAFNFTEPVSGQTFADVSADTAFYEYIERLTARGMLTGYPCGGTLEPCIPPENRPYFRPAANVTRGQAAKISYAALFQPSPTLTPVRPTDTPVIPCCRGVSGIISSYCAFHSQGNWIDVTVTLTNTCSMTVRAQGTKNYEIAPSQNGPWTATHISYYGNLIPPLPEYVTGEDSFWVGPMPAGYSWWREHLQLTGIDPYSCWTLDIATVPQHECVLATPTTTITPYAPQLLEYLPLNLMRHKSK